MYSAKLVNKSLWFSEVTHSSHPCQESGPSGISTDQDYGQHSYPGLTELGNGKVRVWCIFIH